MNDRSTRTPVQSKELSAARIAGRARVATILSEVVHDAMARGTALIPRWQRALAVSETAVRNWLDPTRHKSALTLGDIDALDDESVRLILTRYLEQRFAKRDARRAQHPEHEVIVILTRVGAAARVAREAMADGICSRDEWQRLERELEQMEAEVRDAKLAARAARENGR